MIMLTTEYVWLLHKLVIETSGGEVGVRDSNLLDSAVSGIYQTFDGVDLYLTKEEKAARLAFNLIKDHAFLDGNKRTGLLAMLSFLTINGVYLKYSDKELVRLGLSLAEGKMQYEDLLVWVKKHKTHSKQAETEYMA